MKRQGFCLKNAGSAPAVSARVQAGRLQNGPVDKTPRVALSSPLANKQTQQKGAIAMTAAEPPEPNSQSQPSAAPPPDAPSPEQLKKALKAFKKRLKLMRLDDESTLGGGAMSSGKKSSIVAIMPPHQYPKAVWDELVRQGRLKYSGQGLYELP